MTAPARSISPPETPAQAAFSARSRAPVNFDQRPMLVFWETTRACLLACRHCRASATTVPPPGELSRAEGRDLIDQVAGFGLPYPILVLTGGDCLLRPDLFDLVRYATSVGVPVCLSPSVTPRLTPAMINRIAGCGAKAVSISLDGACAATHDGVRGIAGHFDQTVQAIRSLVGAGVTVQVNTTVMSRERDRAGRHRRADRGDRHAHVGGLLPGARRPRGKHRCHLPGAARGRVPLPVWRVAARVRGAHRRGPVLPPRCGRPAGWPPGPETPLYRDLAGRLDRLLGPGRKPPSAHTAPTRDGKGIVFIAHDGEVYPAGFLPIGLGNVRDRPLRDIYTGDPLLRAIRSAHFTGRCGDCDYADLCGGSRARAYAATGDPLSEDPACPFQS